MKKFLSRTQAKKEIYSFFQLSDFSPEDAKKIKSLAMKHRIRLGHYKHAFCKKCFTQLKGKIRISKEHKAVTCMHCGFKNRWKIR